MSVLDRKILFVTGKGGVGKSVSAAALAWYLADQGKRVLLAEIGERSFFQGFFGLSEVGYYPRPLREGLFVAKWDAESCLKEYVLNYLKVERIYKIFFENKVMRTFLSVAPGVRELAILGKVTDSARKGGDDFDVIVVDSFASGHFRSLVSTPRGMVQVVSRGPIGKQSAEMDKVLTDPKLCGYFVTTIPENLPVSEGVELAEDLQGLLGVRPAFIFNRLLSVPKSAPEKESPKLSEAAKHYWSYLRQQVNTQGVFKKSLEKLSPVFELPQVFKGAGVEQIEELVNGGNWSTFLETTK
jgi:anion-transporting  ArsA/GET3 family ATPase